MTDTIDTALLRAHIEEYDGLGSTYVYVHRQELQTLLDTIDTLRAQLAAQEQAASILAADTRPALPAEPLTVWFGSMPESNGKMNWAVLLRRKDHGGLFGSIASGICFARSEYYGRALYEADRLRYLIGETDKFPHILDYDSESKTPPDANGIAKDQS